MGSHSILTLQKRLSIPSWFLSQLTGQNEVAEKNWLSHKGRNLDLHGTRNLQTGVFGCNVNDHSSNLLSVFERIERQLLEQVLVEFSFSLSQVLFAAGQLNESFVTLDNLSEDFGCDAISSLKRVEFVWRSFNSLQTTN